MLNTTEIADGSVTTTFEEPMQPIASIIFTVYVPAATLAIEFDVEALPISLSILAELAQKSHAYAKALHYRELEFAIQYKGRSTIFLFNCLL